MAVFLMLVVGITGMLEMFYYLPTPENAALSVQTITYHVPFGWLIRNLHYWAAQFLIIVSAVHLVRVVFTGAYAPPRQFNYLLGLALFVFSVLLNFTGYVLRWDTGICYLLVTGTNLLKTIPLIGGFLFRLATGGREACQTALIRFYTWHLFGLSLPVIILMVWHAFRVRRDGGIAVPPADLRTQRDRISRFELVRREVLAMLLAGSTLLVLAAFVPAPIAPAMTGKMVVTGEARAPWFFLWVQQMLRLGNPFIFGVLVPLGMLTILALIPYVFPRPAPEEIGRWFPRSNRLAQVILALIVFLIAALTLLSLLS